ncbi:substrate-binding domain-containing protein [Acidiphilium sp.]|uniref:substrate-binding domain-containing protein n=1 Tax=Acidiphilium sp. TaxID=527 RepID=UPI003D055828
MSEKKCNIRSTTVLTTILLSVAIVGGTRTASAKQNELKFAMVTHAQTGDAYWSIVRKGAEAAAKNDHVRLIYQNNPNAAGEAQLITNVAQQHVDGIAVTIPFPDAEIPALRQAENEGIPIVGLNAGLGVWKKAGLLMYVGEDEKIAGEAVGKRLNSLGAKDVLVVDQLQGAKNLDDRYDGIKKTFKGKVKVLYLSGFDMAVAQSRIVAKLQQDHNIDYVITLGAPFAPTAIQSVKMANSKAKVATFDLSPQAVHLIQEGKLQFAVDQQPYLQGYEAVDFLWLYKTNGDVVGGGKPVLTGPSFVTSKNVAAVAKFAKRGTR